MSREEMLAGTQDLIEEETCLLYAYEADQVLADRQTEPLEDLDLARRVGKDAGRKKPREGSWLHTLRESGLADVKRRSVRRP